MKVKVILDCPLPEDEATREDELTILEALPKMGFTPNPITARMNFMPYATVERIEQIFKESELI